MTLCYYFGLRCKCTSGTTSPHVETFWIHVGLTTVDTCCLQQGSPAETQTAPRGPNHLSLPLPEAGNGTVHRVRSFHSSFWIHTFRVLLILLWCELGDLAIVCSPGGHAFVFAAYWLLGTLKWVNLTPLSSIFIFVLFYLPSKCPQLSAVQFFFNFLPRKKACRELLKSILTCACEFPVWLICFWWSFLIEIADILVLSII